MLVGKPIAILTVEAEESTTNENALPPDGLPAADVPSVEAPIAKEIPAGRTNGKNHVSTDYKSSSKFFSPLVKNIAKEENISVAELETIEGSGAEGRITKKDILNYVETRKLGSTIKPASAFRYSKYVGTKSIGIDKRR